MKRKNWHTIPIQKLGWPIESWTFKRCIGQNLVWALFGNDTDGVTPWFKDRQWGFWEWWLRNRWSNTKKFVIGYMWWEEGNPYAGWNFKHLERIFWIKEKWFVFHWVKPIKRCWLYWRPFAFLKVWRIGAWWGWKRRGQFAASMKMI